MNKKIFTLFLFGFLAGLGFVSSYAGDYNGTQSEIGAEVGVVADLLATEAWFEIKVNTSEIDFGTIKLGKEWNTYRKKYEITAKGNVNITVKPELINDTAGNLFSNLYFARTFETSLSNWDKIGNYEIKFNLSGDTGLSFRNAIDPETGLSSSTPSQSVLLNVENFNGIVPFPEERRNTVKFVIVPDWNSISDPSP
jgi:hypothetical protein